MTATPAPASAPPDPADPPLDDARRFIWLQHFATALLLAVIWLAFLELAVHDRERALQATAERGNNLALAIEQYAVRVLRNAEAVTQLVAAEYERGARGPQLQRILRERAENNDALAEVLVVQPDGRLLLSHRADSALVIQAPLPPGAPAYRIFIGQPLPGTGLVPLARPILAQGVLEGWAVVLVPRAGFLGLLAEHRIEEDTLVELARRDGTSIADWRNRPPDAAASTELRRVTSQRDFREYPLRASVATSEQDALAELSRRSRLYLAVSLAVSAMVIALNVDVARAARRRAALARGLRDAKERLAALNSDLEQQIARRTAQLQRANEALESFSYSVAHDLRAPLATIEGFSGMLVPAIEATQDEKLVRYLRRVRECAVQMEEITTGLLELARLGRQPLVRQQVDLAAKAHAVADALREREPQRRVEVIVQPDLRAEGDPALLRQVLENLVGNAWKFLRDTPAARIEVGSVRGADGTQEFFVRDNGPGFDPERAAALFKPFQRLHGREFAGTGIGLTTVRRIVELHGGRVWAAAQPGAGATFFFTLPGSADS